MPFKVTGKERSATIGYDVDFDRYRFAVTDEQGVELASDLDRPDQCPSLTEIAELLETYGLGFPIEYRKRLALERRDARQAGTAGRLNWKE